MVLSLGGAFAVRLLCECDQRVHNALKKRLPLDRIRCVRLYMLCLYLNRKQVTLDAGRLKEIEILKSQVSSLEESVSVFG